MEDIEITSFETTQPILSEMKRQLVRIANLLRVDDVGNLHVLDYAWFPREYMSTKFRDKVIFKTGVLPDLPHIQRRRLQFPGQIGIGIYQYVSHLDPTLEYCLYCCRGQYSDEVYLVVPKGKLMRLKRTALALNKLANALTLPPVLREGMLDNIIKNTVGFLLKAKKIERYGVKIKRGVLLTGEPGNGKTMLCRHIQKLCSQNGIDWGVITSADIDQAYNDKALNDLFTAYTVSFFDDIDIQYMDRTKGNGKMACSLLTAMDGMYDSGHLVRVFTTNEEIKDLDAAFTRPGRIDKIVTLDKPDESMRRQLVDTWPEEIRDHIDVDVCIESSNGYSFAELEAIRTFLVTNKILGDDTWNLDSAFEEYDSRKDENEKRGVGFSGDIGGSKRSKHPRHDNSLPSRSNTNQPDWNDE
jgi:hypothetical protein